MTATYALKYVTYFILFPHEQPTPLNTSKTYVKKIEVKCDSAYGRKGHNISGKSSNKLYITPMEYGSTLIQMVYIVV